MSRLTEPGKNTRLDHYTGIDWFPTWLWNLVFRWLTVGHVDFTLFLSQHFFFSFQVLWPRPLWFCFVCNFFLLHTFVLLFFNLTILIFFPLFYLFHDYYFELMESFWCKSMQSLIANSVGGMCVKMGNESEPIFSTRAVQLLTELLGLAQC